MCLFAISEHSEMALTIIKNWILSEFTRSTRSVLVRKSLNKLR